MRDLVDFFPQFLRNLRKKNKSRYCAKRIRPHRTRSKSPFESVSTFVFSVFAGFFDCQRQPEANLAKSETEE